MRQIQSGHDLRRIGFAAALSAAEARRNRRRPFLPRDGVRSIRIRKPFLRPLLRRFVTEYGTLHSNWRLNRCGQRRIPGELQKELRQHRIMGQGNPARDFDPGDSRKNAGIPDVCPVFHTVRLGQTIRRSPQSPLCGAAFRKQSCHPSLSQWIPGSLPLFLCAAYYLLNSSRMTSEVAIVWNVSPSTIRRLNSMS